MYIIISTILILLCTACTHTSAENKNHISLQVPELLSSNHTITHGTLVTEYGYYYTKNASQETIIIGPCSPCIGIQICDKESDTCLYAHMHARNDPEDLVKKINLHFTTQSVAKKPSLDVTIFTRTNEDNFSNWKFSEGSHKQRTIHIKDRLSEAFDVPKIITYYHQTSKHTNYNNDDRYIIFINKKIYRINPDMYAFLNQYRVDRFMEKKFKKNFGLKAYSIIPWNIWSTYNNPLYRIKKPNIQNIGALSACKNNAFTQFLSPFYMQIASILFWKSGLSFAVKFIIDYIYTSSPKKL